MDTLVLGLVVMAQAVLMTSGTVRLSDGLNDREGRLEVQYSGTWGTVCGITWTQEDSTVVCTQLGFTGEARFFFLPSPYGPGSGRIWLERVNCTGGERTLEDCPHSPWGTLVTSCNHYDDVGIVCLGDRIGRPSVVTRPQPRPPPPAACTNESIRLSGGMTSREGRVELTYRGRWGTVCDDAWDARAAAIVCNMLGYEPGSESRALTSPVPFGRGRTERIWLDDVICGLGGEKCLSQCGSLGWGNHDCTHYEDAGVICLGELILDPQTTIQPSTTSTTSSMPTTTPRTTTSTTTPTTTASTTTRSTTPPTTPPTTTTTSTTVTTRSTPTKTRSTTLSQILSSTPEGIILLPTSRTPFVPRTTEMPTTPSTKVRYSTTSTTPRQRSSPSTVTRSTARRRLDTTTLSTTPISATSRLQATTTAGTLYLSSTTTGFVTFSSPTTYTTSSDGLNGEVPVGGVAAGVVLAGLVVGAILYGILIIRRQ